MLRYTRNKFRKESISAKLIEKKRVSILLFLEKCQVQKLFIKQSKNTRDFSYEMN